MTTIEALNKIKVLLGLEGETQEEAKVEFAEGKLEDGTIIQYDTLEVGGLVSKVLEDGTTEVLTQGEYTLEDGTVISIGEEGAIIEPANDEETEMEEEKVEKENDVELEVETEGEAQDVVAEERSVEERIDALEKSVKSILEVLDGVTKMTSQISEIETKLSEIAEQPAATSIENTPVFEDKPLTNLEKRISAIDFARKNKN